MINVKKILGGFFYKWFGTGFIRKHITTALASLGGLLAVYLKSNNVDIDSELFNRWLHDTSEVLIIVISYIIGLLIDLKPSTPKVVKE